VRFLGAVPHRDIFKYFSIADVFLSLYDVSNLGNPLLEAMWAGLPIVTIDDRSTDELLQDGESVFLIPHKQLEEQLPLKVRTLLTNESLRRQMAERSKKIAEDKILSWEDRMRLEEDLIQRLIASKKIKFQEAMQDDKSELPLCQFDHSLQE
jgi:glycosyltransferase involved in cell wall biosynthesis